MKTCRPTISRCSDFSSVEFPEGLTDALEFAEHPLTLPQGSGSACTFALHDAEREMGIVTVELDPAGLTNLVLVDLQDKGSALLHTVLYFS
jgi:hypothetical protein